MPKLLWEAIWWHEKNVLMLPTNTRHFWDHLCLLHWCSPRAKPRWDINVHLSAAGSGIITRVCIIEWIGWFDFLCVQTADDLLKSQEWSVINSTCHMKSKQESLPIRTGARLVAMFRQEMWNVFVCSRGEGSAVPLLSTCHDLQVFEKNVPGHEHRLIGCVEQLGFNISKLWKD